MTQPMHSSAKPKRAKKSNEVYEYDNVTEVFRLLFDLGLFTQVEVAQTVGLSQSAISEWLSGKRRIQFPVFKTLAQLWGLDGSVFTRPFKEVEREILPRLEAADKVREQKIREALAALSMERKRGKVGENFQTTLSFDDDSGRGRHLQTVK